MKLIVDECLSRSTNLLLKNVGFEIITINIILNFGVDDEKFYEINNYGN